MTLRIRLPLRIVPLPESIKVEDAAGVAVAYCYFEDQPDRRDQTRRMTRAEAVRVAQITARAVNDAVERER